MKTFAAEKRRSIDFTGARRGAVVKPESGKTKISIRLDNAVLEHFRRLVDKAGGGNYQTLINDALLEHIQRRSILDVVRAVVREELASYRVLGALRQKLSGKSALGKLALPGRRSERRRAAGANPGQHRRQLN